MNHKTTHKPCTHRQCSAAATQQVLAGGSFLPVCDEHAAPFEHRIPADWSAYPGWAAAAVEDAQPVLGDDCAWPGCANIAARRVLAGGSSLPVCDDHEGWGSGLGG